MEGQALFQTDGAPVQTLFSVPAEDSVPVHETLALCLRTTINNKREQYRMEIRRQKIFCDLNQRRETLSTQKPTHQLLLDLKLAMQELINLAEAPTDSFLAQGSTEVEELRLAAVQQSIRTVREAHSVLLRRDSKTCYTLDHFLKNPSVFELVISILRQFKEKRNWAPVADVLALLFSSLQCSEESAQLARLLYQRGCVEWLDTIIRTADLAEQVFEASDLLAEMIINSVQVLKDVLLRQILEYLMGLTRKIESLPSRVLATDVQKLENHVCTLGNLFYAMSEACAQRDSEDNFPQFCNEQQLQLCQITRVFAKQCDLTNDTQFNFFVFRSLYNMATAFPEVLQQFTQSDFIWVVRRKLLHYTTNNDLETVRNIVNIASLYTQDDMTLKQAFAPIDDANIDLWNLLMGLVDLQKTQNSKKFAARSGTYSILRRNIYFIFSNLACSSNEIFQEFEHRQIPSLLLSNFQLETSPMSQYELLFALCNYFMRTSFENQCLLATNNEFLAHLAQVLKDCVVTRVKMKCIEILDYLLDCGVQQQTTKKLQTNPVRLSLEQNCVTHTLEELQEHPDQGLYAMVYALIVKHFEHSTRD